MKGKNKHAFTTGSQQRGDTQWAKIQLKTHTFIKETNNPSHRKHSSSFFLLSLQSFPLECVRFLNFVLDLFTNSSNCLWGMCFLIFGLKFPVSLFTLRQRAWRWQKRNRTHTVKLDMGSLWRSPTFLVYDGSVGCEMLLRWRTTPAGLASLRAVCMCDLFLLRVQTFQCNIL